MMGDKHDWDTIRWYRGIENTVVMKSVETFKLIVSYNTIYLLGLSRLSGTRMISVISVIKIISVISY